MAKQNMAYMYNGMSFSLRNDALTHAATRVNLEGIINKPDTKDKLIQFHIEEVSRVVRFTDTKSRMMVFGKQSSCLMSSEFWFGKMESILEMDSSDGYTNSMNILNALKHS